MTTELINPIKLRKNIYKGCQHCHGDLRLERDPDLPREVLAYEYVCLQCGRHASLRSVLQSLASRLEAA
jgi:hypothetical protein